MVVVVGVVVVVVGFGFVVAVDVIDVVVVLQFRRAGCLQACATRRWRVHLKTRARVGAGEGAQEVREHLHSIAAISERQVSTSVRARWKGVAPKKIGRGCGGRRSASLAERAPMQGQHGDKKVRQRKNRRVQRRCRRGGLRCCCCCCSTHAQGSGGLFENKGSWRGAAPSPRSQAKVFVSFVVVGFVVSAVVIVVVIVVVAHTPLL